MVVADSLGLKIMTFGPKFGWFDPPTQPVAAVLIVQVKVAEPDAPVASLCATLMLAVAAAVAAICRLAAVPTAPTWLPGLVTVTVSPGPVLPPAGEISMPLT